jgi:hypothetical protein
VTQPVIQVDDWVLVCETGEKGKVLDVFDEGERFLLSIPENKSWPFPRRMHVMIEKIRKIRPPKPEEFGPKWEQTGLF